MSGLLRRQSVQASGLAVLLDRSENWKKVYQTDLGTCFLGDNGQMPPRTADFVARLHAAKIETSDKLPWWIAAGYDVAALVAAAVRSGAETSDQFTAHWNTAGPFDGIYGDYAWAPGQHNGYPDSGVVMSQANSFRDGAFRLAPGYD